MKIRLELVGNDGRVLASTYRALPNAHDYEHQCKVIEAETKYMAMQLSAALPKLVSERLKGRS